MHQQKNTTYSAKYQYAQWYVDPVVTHKQFATERLAPAGQKSAHIARNSTQFTDFCRSIMRQQMRRRIYQGEGRGHEG
jgi:hypothetical protein